MALSALALQVIGGGSTQDPVSAELWLSALLRVFYADTSPPGWVGMQDVEIIFPPDSTPIQIKGRMSDGVIAHAIATWPNDPIAALQSNDIILPDLQRG